MQIQTFFRDHLLATKAVAGMSGFDSTTLFTVTGDVAVRVIGSVVTAVTSTGGTCTLEIGTAEDTDGIVGATTVDNVQFALTDVWTDTTPANDVDAISSFYVIAGGADIVLTRAGADDITAGAITFYCEWYPYSSDGNVVSA